MCMKIQITVNDLEPSVRELYKEGKIRQMSIDYQPNAIMGWVDREEIEVFNFSRILRMDNRYSGYELHTNDDSITVEITNM